jgi:5-methylcytosine-specific restriction endonuclease McrA
MDHTMNPDENYADAYWADPSNGAAKRVGHYLWKVVGEGQKFDKATLRRIVRDTEQVDRRMRDLRKVGWRIRTYRDMALLKPSELYLEKVGDHIWEDGYKWPKDGISAAARRRVLDRDGRRCMVCGIDFGEEFPDRPGEVARPTIGHIIPKERGGSITDLANLRPECQLCNEPAKNLTALPADLELLKREVVGLSRSDRATMSRWMAADRRTYSSVERLWAQYCQLPEPMRAEVRMSLDELL